MSKKSRDFLALLGRSNREVVTSLLRPGSIEWPTKGKHASVLVPLHFHKEQPSVLFTVRSSNLNRHRSQVRYVRWVMYFTIFASSNRQLAARGYHPLLYAQLSRRARRCGGQRCGTYGPQGDRGRTGDSSIRS